MFGNHPSKAPNNNLAQERIYYELKLRDAFNQACDNSQNLILNEETWMYFVALLMRSKLASVRDSETLEKVRPSFPLEFDTFMQTVNQAFGDQSLKQLNLQFDETQEQLENCRTFINMMNISLLERDELKQLASLIHNSCKKAEKAQEAMSLIFKGIKNSSEDVHGFVWDRITGPNYKQIKLPHETVKQDKATLEREFIQRRVRTVHYRKLPVKVLKKYETGIEKVLAFCCDTDKPIECFKIPKTFAYYEVLTQFFNQIGATKELLLSKYCPSYLGFDDQTDPDFNQYFFEIKKGKSLWKLMQAQGGKSLTRHEPLFKYWAKELLYAFRDITYKSTFTLQKPITLKNVFVSDIGIKVYLKKIKFGDQRDDNIDYHLHQESIILAMYAMLLLQMFTNKDYQCMGEKDSLEQAESDLAHLQDISPELKCLLYECLHAQDKTLQREEDRYDYEISRQINKELNLQKGGRDEDFFQQEAFKDMMKIEAENQEKEEAKLQRMIKRKPDNPQASMKKYETENQRMGILNEVDLVLQHIYPNQELENKYKQQAIGKFDTGKVGFTEEDDKVIKKEKEIRYLTVDSLLIHPYFIGINEADISIVIDEFEKLLQVAEND